MNPAFKRLSIAGLLVLIIVVIGEMFAYEVIKLNWISFMEIQPAFQPMYKPLAAPTDSVPAEGVAYNLPMGVPSNPMPGDPASIQRGSELFAINCAICHGSGGKGNGTIAAKLKNKPFDLTSFPIKSFFDGGLFFSISTGVPNKMPALNEDLTVSERWDVVNYIRTLK
jgi:mono/diheme cytochrome c family protein